jgi:hypothetical protein
LKIIDGAYQDWPCNSISPIEETTQPEKEQEGQQFIKYDSNHTFV